MTSGNGILVVIPARAGSQRLPRKNVLPLAGKPLICWTIEVALQASLDARIVVTSDDEEVLAIASQYQDRGILGYRRPSELATDDASTSDVLLNLLEGERAAGREVATIVLLQPTSPLRSVEDIQQALELYERHGAANKTVVSVCKVDHPIGWNGDVGPDLSFERFRIGEEGDRAPEYRLNGAVYVIPVSEFMEHGNILEEPLIASVMPRERSVDIDDALDFRLCDALLRT